MLHESFANWYLYLHELNRVICQLDKKIEFTAFYAKCYAYNRLDQSGKDVYVNDIFTRENYEMLSKYVYGFLLRDADSLRDGCPEFTFVISEFHNFVIEHEMGAYHAGRKRKVAGGGGGFSVEHDALLQFEDGGSSNQESDAALLAPVGRMAQKADISTLLREMRQVCV
jgi:hypothetical protein